MLATLLSYLIVANQTCCFMGICSRHIATKHTIIQYTWAAQVQSLCCRRSASPPMRAFRLFVQTKMCKFCRSSGLPLPGLKYELFSEGRGYSDIYLNVDILLFWRMGQRMGGRNVSDDVWPFYYHHAIRLSVTCYLTCKKYLDKNWHEVWPHFGASMRNFYFWSSKEGQRCHFTQKQKYWNSFGHWTIQLKFPVTR